MIKSIYTRVFYNEIIKLFSYRSDFWIQFLGSVLVHFCLSYYLWESIFSYNGIHHINGLEFSYFVFYSLIIPFIDRSITGQKELFSQDIYSGDLNKYLVYPVSFLKYKYVTHLSKCFLSMIQMLVFIPLLVFFVKNLGYPRYSLWNLFLGTFYCFLCTSLYYFMAACLEMIAFWTDNVWSLKLMLKWVITFLEGAFVPLDLFPAWAKSGVEVLPFHLLLSFPAHLIMGELTHFEILKGMVLLLFWLGFFAFLSNLIWKKALKSYSGIGM